MSSSTDSAAAPQLSRQDLHDALRTRLIQSGEYSRVMEVLRHRLDAAAWADQVRDVAREKARVQDPPNLHQLIEELEPTALGMIPPEVRAEVEKMVQSFVSQAVE
ncbi:SPOSA6832_00363 [Sporobolomyces salmonicolor]|uniref:Transcription and mRNA export factor SUS1 n=1 Tax=Sporidiobolus salmonicolor TaxID=5005 RepID=A0A0D6EFZ3_SPOSA|nr:SPOSA6832_00363 [Sporobolomyces salmonicolor]